MTRALYRTYRPATFEDLLGQELIGHILQESARQDKLAHAYLFAGPRGTGKTTTARLVAKIANCETRYTDPKFHKKGEPCNECSSCKEIDEGRHLDVLEIDAASNRGIDEMRELKENIRLAPSRGHYKVFIIDEAHQLTKDASNALLKTLEEPPEKVMIILATTEAEKLPATILSRVQQFYFSHIPLKVMIEKLAHIAKEEKIDIEKDALELVAVSAEGSFRDAESLLDQLASFHDSAITLEKVEIMIGKVGFRTLSSCAELILKNKRAETLAKLSELYDSGANIVQFTKDMIEYLRRTAVLHYNPTLKTLFEKELTASHLETLIAHSKIFSDAHLALLKALISAYSQMRYSQFPIIPLEVAVMENLK